MNKDAAAATYRLLGNKLSVNIMRACAPRRKTLMPGVITALFRRQDVTRIRTPCTGAMSVLFAALNVISMSLSPMMGSTH